MRAGLSCLLNESMACTGHGIESALSIEDAEEIVGGDARRQDWPLFIGESALRFSLDSGATQAVNGFERGSTLCIFLEFEVGDRSEERRVGKQWRSGST